MSGIDFLAIGIAAQPMATSLGISLAELQWFFSAFAIGNASFLVVSGRLSDLYGRKAIFVIGSVLFIFTSIVIAASSSPWIIILARLIQGASCGTTTSAAIAILARTYAPLERARWIAGLVGTTGLGMTLGPILGGFLIHAWSWRLIFLINVPIGLLGLMFTWIYMPNQPSQEVKRQELNLLGMSLLTGMLVCLTIGISQGPYWGWSSSKTLTAFTSSFLLLILFWIRERTHHAPIIRKELFRIKHFLAANAVAACLYFTLTAWVFIIGLYLERVASLSAEQAGMSFLPFGLATLLLFTQASKLSRYFKIRSLVVCGCTLNVIAFGLMSFFPIYPPHWLMILCFSLFGAGFLLVNAYTMQMGIEHVPVEISGIASGKSMMIRWFSGAVGVVVMATFFSTEASSSYGGPTSAKLKEVITGQKQTSDAFFAQELIRQAYHYGLVMSIRVFFCISILALLISLRFTNKHK